MATKPAKKKPAKAKVAGSTTSSTTSSAARASTPRADAKAPKTGSAVIPFNPVSAETLRNFTAAAPNFGSAFGPDFKMSFELPFKLPFDSMESNMSNYKDQYEKMGEEAQNFMRQNAESCSKTSQSFAKGAEKMMKTIAEVAQESAQRNSESFKALMACRTINEFAEAQNKLVQQNFDDAMSTATKLSEMAIKICNEAIEPINGQMAKAMKKMSEAA